MQTKSATLKPNARAQRQKAREQEWTPTPQAIASILSEAITPSLQPVTNAIACLENTNG
jgi:hypothetical protein